jgi:hypothetical protein
VYLLVLVNSTILTLIGLSALAVTRIQRRAAEGTGAAVQSRLLAESAVDAGLFVIDNNVDWRMDHASDTWSNAISLGGGILQYKFVDEIDGELGDDSGDSVRLYGRGQIDETMRMFSVQLAPVAKSIDMTANAGFEDGPRLWNGFFCDMQIGTNESPVGTAHLRANNRLSHWSSVYQDLSSTLQHQGKYVLDVWIRMSDAPENIQVSLLMMTSAGFQSTTVSLPADTNWSHVTQEINATWTGTLYSATLSIATTSTSQPFMLDQVMLLESREEPSVPIPGTWRREMAY